MKEEVVYILTLFVMIILFVAGIGVGHTVASDSYKTQAYERGFMYKEITKDDQVIYKWKESIKLNDGKEQK